MQASIRFVLTTCVWPTLQPRKETENLTTPVVLNKKLQDSPRRFHLFLLLPPRPRRCHLSPTMPLISKENKILSLLCRSQSYARTTNKPVKRHWMSLVPLSVSDCFVLLSTAAEFYHFTLVLSQSFSLTYIAQIFLQPWKQHWVVVSTRRKVLSF